MQKQFQSKFSLNLAKKFIFLSMSLFALLFISGCPETVRTVTGPTVTNFPPLLVGNQTIAFTYNSHASYALYNRGGVVESCRLFTDGEDATNVLPLGLSVDVSDGECVLRGMSSNLTWTNRNLSLIGSIPVEVEASNGDGISRVPVNVIVEPRYWQGDLSYRLVYSGGNVGDYGDETGISGIFWDDGQHLVYKADAIPFASGGTGAYNDPVLIGIDANVGNFSIVLDFVDVVVPVDNFSNRTNAVEKNFHINFLLKPDSYSALRSEGLQLMESVTNGSWLVKLHTIDKETLMTNLVRSDGYQIGNNPPSYSTSMGNSNILPVLNAQFFTAANDIKFITGKVRLTFDFD